MNKRLAVIALSAVAVVVIGALLLSHLAQPAGKSSAKKSSSVTFEPVQAPTSADTSKRDLKNQTVSNEDTLIAMQQSNKQSLQSTDYSIESKEQVVSGWYLVIINPIDKSSDPAQVIMKAEGGQLVVVSGPGTAFSRSDLSAKGVPQALQDRLLVSDD